jgi:hypothetical protein
MPRKSATATPAATAANPTATPAATPAATNTATHPANPTATHTANPTATHAATHTATPAANPTATHAATHTANPSLGGGTPAEDQALKNINYKNMLLTGNYGLLKPDVITHPNIDNILENEKNANKSDPWNKLDKSAKVIKLKEFATRYGKEQDCNDAEITALYRFLIANLEQKKLLRAKDVVYDKVTGIVTSIPCLIYHAGLKKFTLKRCEKRQSTLKSLAPTTNMSKKRRLGADVADATAAAATATTESLLN